ncbi:MAG: response regulator transcription factor [Acidobacteriota bacterium]
MRVLLADDHALLLEGLQNLLEAHGVEVVGAAMDGRQAAIEARRLKPDVILMDIRMPVCNGLTATRLIKAEMPDVKIIMLTTSNEDQDLFEAVKSGANGYLLKSMDAESLIEALDDTEHDIPPFAPGLAAKLLAEFALTAQQASAEAAAGEPSSGEVGAAAPMPSRALETEEALSPRQAEVLGLVAQGLSYKEVGARVYLSPRTVKYHMAEIMRKLHLQNRAQVLAYASTATVEQTQEPR